MSERLCFPRESGRHAAINIEIRVSTLLFKEKLRECQGLRRGLNCYLREFLLN